MQRLVLDFELTVLFPLILASIIALWSAVRLYRWPSDELHEASFVTGEALIEWKQKRSYEKWRAKLSIRSSAIWLVALLAVLILKDPWKIELANATWNILVYVAGTSFLGAAYLAGCYAVHQRKRGFFTCLLVMVLAVSSGEHFLHEAINTGRVIWPTSSSAQ